MAITRYRCYDDAVVDYTKFELLWQDLDRSKMFDYLFRVLNIFNPLTDKASQFRKIGRWDDANCVYDEINRYIALIHLMIMLKEELGECSDLEDFEDKYEEYKLDCIRDTFRCTFGNTTIVDEFINLLGLRVPLTGISYMTIDDDTCLVFSPRDPNA